ncbi:MAG: hypothetical protein Q8P84_07190 [Deltaproteobacteria bacterium]|nr:hypothetical protein [Deltaproteobacteria bacterium]
MGESNLSVRSIPFNYSAYFILAPESAVKPSTHLEKSIDHFVDVGGHRRQPRWFQLNFSPSSLFGTPKMVAHKVFKPERPDFLKPDTGAKPVKKDFPEWASPGACVLPTCGRVF